MPPIAPSLGQRLQRLFLTGLLTLLPIWLTWVVVKFVFGLLSDLSRPVVDPTLDSLAALDPRTLAWLEDPWVGTAIALVATVVVILLAGWLARRVFGQRMLRWFDAPVRDAAGDVVAMVRKQLYVRRKRPKD